MRCFDFFRRRLSVSHSFVETSVKLSKRFFLNELVLTKESLRYMFFLIDNMIKFSRIADFDLDAGNVKTAVVLARVQVGFFVVDVNEVHMDELVYAILAFSLG